METVLLVAGVWGCLISLVIAFFRGASRETPPEQPSEFSLFLAEKESRVDRMHFRQTTRWREGIK
jgi:hypothetical protein